MVASLNIVVVEDHDSLREVTVAGLCFAGHNAVGVESAEELTEQCEIQNIDLIVIDLNLPGEDGISLSRRIRRVDPEIGIIMLTARSHLAEKVLGYESGADIYLTKPTSMEELCASILALKRRIAKKKAPELRLDMSHFSLHGPEVSVELSRREALVLSAFLRMPNQTLETWQLMEMVYHDVENCLKTSLEVQIARLRKKLLQAGAANPTIKSIRNEGYQLYSRIIFM